MLDQVLLAIHILVVGYWFGSELVINSTYRYVSYARGMPFAERDRLMDHVMNADQHVRYALVLQMGLGLTLAARLGYLSGGETLAWTAALGATAWMFLVEATHRLRKELIGKDLAGIDRLIRYAAIAALVTTALAALTGSFDLQGWLVWKFIAYAGVISCGLSIRFFIMDFYRAWVEIAKNGSTDANEAVIQKTYVGATAVLVGLWVFIAIIVVLSVWKPA
ncbi:MAG: hypothetical protein FJX59_15260 [Alphaproteobacteria bacterium]|nr:hypothetical protein [Alphaproteobacteria bacterium]